MPSYLATIRYESPADDEARSMATEMAFLPGWPSEVVSVEREDAAPPEAVAAVRALSPAVVDELRQMWRSDARDEAKLVVREFVPGTYRYRIP